MPLGRRREGSYSRAAMATAERSARSAPSGPPHNLEAEASVLGAILLSDRTMYGLVIEDGLADRRQDFRSIEDILDVELDKLHRLSTEHTSLTGTPSGFKDLDELTGGFQPGNLVVIAARPSMGKSALVTNIAEHAALDH